MLELKRAHDESTDEYITVLKPSAVGFDRVNRADFEKAVRKACRTGKYEDYEAYMQFFTKNQWGSI